MVGCAVLGAAYIGGSVLVNRNLAKYSVRGELLDDKIQSTAIGLFYRVNMQTEDGIVSYPILASEEGLSQLEAEFNGRYEGEGRERGNVLAINQVSNVISLDEVVLLPKNIRKLTGMKREAVLENIKTDYKLSNGMEIPGYLVVGVKLEDNMDVIEVDTGYGPEFNLRIIDEGDGKPYHFVEHISKGAKMQEKRFNMTYRFCDKHDPIPIWHPTGFR